MPFPDYLCVCLLGFAKYPVIIENDPELFLRVSFIILIAAFLFLCWKQIKATG